MRRLLISVAVLALATAPALAQPGDEHGHGHRDSGPGQGAQQHGGPGPAPGTQRPSAPQPQAQPAPPRGGPTSFTNQIQGHQPNQGQGEQGHGHRLQAGPQPQAAPPQPAPQQGQRGPNRFDGQPNSGDRGNNGRDFRAGGPGRPGNPNFNNGPRRDFSGFRDFHRDFRSARRFHVAPYRAPAGFYVHHWIFGEFLPQPYWARDYWLLNFAAYGLPPPPYGAVWVRVGGDALLIDEYSGEVITVEYDVFY